MCGEDGTWGMIQSVIGAVGVGIPEWHLFFLKMLITATTTVTFPVFGVSLAISSDFIVSLRAVSTTLIGWGL